MGALEALERTQENNFHLRNVKRVGGTSAGAITSVLLAVGYSTEQIKEFLFNLDFSNFLDGPNGAALLQLKKTFESNIFGFVSNLSKAFGNASKIKSIIDELKKSRGIFTGDYFREWIEEKVAAKLGKQWATFKDLEDKRNNDNSFKELFIVGMNLTKKKSEVFSYLDTPDLIISDAVRISMSIPLLFQPHKYYVKSSDGNSRIVKTSRSGEIFVDGGLLDNYPLWLFDNSKFIGNSMGNRTNGTCFVNYQTLGFRLVSLQSKIDYENSLNDNNLISETLASEGNSEINSIISFIKNIGTRIC